MRITKLFETDVNELAEYLAEGGVAVIPTDTVYGIVTVPDCRAAHDRIYELKQRPQEKKLIILAAEIAMVEQMAGITDLGYDLIRKFWPGALTIILNTTAGCSMGFRIPDYPWLLTLMRHLAGPLVSTSANPSDKPPALSGNVVCDYFQTIDKLWLVDGGTLPEQLPSTIVDLRPPTPMILRRGHLAGVVEQQISK